MITDITPSLRVFISSESESAYIEYKEGKEFIRIPVPKAVAQRIKEEKEREDCDTAMRIDTEAKRRAHEYFEGPQRNKRTSDWEQGTGGFIYRNRTGTACE